MLSRVVDNVVAAADPGHDTDLAKYEMPGCLLRRETYFAAGCVCVCVCVCANRATFLFVQIVIYHTRHVSDNAN